MVQLNKGLWLLSAGLFVTTMVGCKDSVKTIEATAETEFEHKAESFADLQILKYEVPGWEDLTLQQKELEYYLYEAAIAGRDIIYDQRGKYNLMVRKVLEAIWSSDSIDKNSEEWEAFRTYSGQFWFSNGIHHHYSNYKFKPEFSYEFFESMVKEINPSDLPLTEGETVEDLLETLQKVIFDENYLPMLQDTRPNIDHVVNSARSEEHTSELQSRENLVCRLLLEKKKHLHII